MEHILKVLTSFFTGVFAAAIGYFMPVKDIVHLMLFFFILDIIFGYWASRKLNGSRFKVSIVWGHTVPRMLISIVITLCAFMWDSTYHQDYISTYKIIGWFISGLLLYSIAENGYYITKWTIFKKIGRVIKREIHDKTESKFSN